MNTPRTDAIYDPALLDRGIAENGRTWGWGTLSDMRDLARVLEREGNQLRAQVEQLKAERNAADVRARLEWGEKVEQWKAYAERLEEAGDDFSGWITARLIASPNKPAHYEIKAVEDWQKAKETKP